MHYSAGKRPAVGCPGKIAAIAGPDLPACRHDRSAILSVAERPLPGTTTVWNLRVLRP